MPWEATDNELSFANASTGHVEHKLKIKRPIGAVFSSTTAASEYPVLIECFELTNGQPKSIGEYVDDGDLTNSKTAVGNPS